MYVSPDHPIDYHLINPNTVLDAPPTHPPTVYDLIANVTHESVAGTTRDKEHTVWKTHLRAAGGGGEGEKWFRIQDLIVEEARKEMIFLGETVLQVSVFLFWWFLSI
jgi:U4/U6.U5 tri-snRNP-associated protein 2